MIKIKPEKCNGCGKCVEACTVGAIIMGVVAQIQNHRCISCRNCLLVCPQKAIVIR